jgi:hypothetical protein
MAAADQAAQLREQADALEKEAKLEAKLLEAKDAYRDNRDDEKAKQRLHKAKADMVEARQTRRDAGVTSGGDAVQSNGNEG